MTIYLIIGIIIGTAAVQVSLNDGPLLNGRYSKTTEILGYIIAFLFIVFTWPVWAGIYLSRFV